MTNWNNLTFEGRLATWREYRQSLKNINSSDYQDFATFFSTFPISSRTLDYYDPESWHTPWEILKYSYFCRSSISLLIYHTLMMIEHNINIKLLLIDDGDEIYLVPVVDDDIVFNYNIGSTISLESIRESITVLNTFKPHSY